MIQTYRVHYFDSTGRAEPIRMILSYGGLDFEDIRLSKGDFQKLKSTLPLGQLPVLEIDGNLYPQSTAICRFLASKVNLGGKDETENFKIDITFETIEDLTRKVSEWAHERDEHRKHVLEKELVGEKIPFYFNNLDTIAANNNGYIALERISWVDIIFLCRFESLTNLLKKDILVDYPNLTKVVKNVLEVPSIKQWIKKRPTNTTSNFDLKSLL